MLFISFFLVAGMNIEADEFYDRGFYDRALSGYLECRERGFSSPQLYLNIGNCYYRKGEFGKSLLYYRKAWFLDPGLPEIRKNISLFGGKTETPNPFISFLQDIINRISIRVFFWLLLGALTVLSVLFSLKFIQKVRHFYLPFIPILIISGVFFLFSLSGFLIWYGRVDSKWVVTTRAGTLRSGPGTRYKELGKLEETEEGYLVRKSKGWWLIHLHSGEGGWVDSTKVSLVLEDMR